jgi:hypothetical protein
MKTKHLILCAILVVTAITACKKDYPKDTPKWLVAKIKEYKKAKSCSMVHFPYIQKFVNTANQENIYIIRTGGQFNTKYVVYDFNGNIICSAPYFLKGDSCGVIPTNNFLGSQAGIVIWSCNN